MNRLVRICLVLSTVEMLALDGFLLWAELNPRTHAHGLATLLLFTSYLPVLLLLAGWRRLEQGAGATPATLPSTVTATVPAPNLATKLASKPASNPAMKRATKPASLPLWICPALRIVTVAITVGYAALWVFAVRLFL